MGSLQLRHFNSQYFLDLLVNFLSNFGIRLLRSFKLNLYLFLKVFTVVKEIRIVNSIFGSKLADDALKSSQKLICFNPRPYFGFRVVLPFQNQIQNLLDVGPCLVKLL